jgi:hypothetical protein
VQDGADLATFSFEIAPSHDAHSANERIQGLTLLRPVSISLQEADLPAFVLNHVALAGIRSIWRDLEPTFQRILPGDISDLLEKAAGQAMNTPTELSSGNAAVDAANFELWCQQNGLRIPGKEFTDRQIQQEREEQDRDERKNQELDEWLNKGDSTSFHIREL